MSKAEIPKPDETWQDDGELTDADKALLDRELAEYQKNPDRGRPWREVLDEIRGKLRP